MSSDMIGHFGKPVTVTRFEASRQVQTLEFDGDFVLDNKINMDVDGSPMDEVEFETDHDTTMSALAAEIQDLEPVWSAEVTAPREITITAEHAGAELTITDLIVTGGSVQPVGSISAASGGYVDGVYQPGATTTFAAIMSVQPLTGKELLLLPEGQRTRLHVKGYTRTELKTADQAESKKADRVSYADTEFEVQNVESWDGGGLSHCKVIMAEVNQ